MTRGCKICYVNVTSNFDDDDERQLEKKCGETKFCVSTVLLNLDSKVTHLESNHKENIVSLLHQYKDFISRCS